MKRLVHSSWRANHLPRFPSSTKPIIQHRLFVRRFTSIPKKSISDLRNEFLSYYKEHNHTILPSSSLVPHDPTLLFTNAGMVQFKDLFQGIEKPSENHKRIATVQKCLRVGGKHNDLDNVGRTARHHSFFEMLGYGKEEAIHLAWNFLTNRLQIPPERLRVTVHQSDTKAKDIWRQQIGLPIDRILEGEEDNFWSMGDGPGPCGPCTEIFFEQSQADSDGERWLEIWNLVFMEKYRQSNGNLTQLPVPCIDTGMGLERLASVMQQQPSNFDIDLLQHLRTAVGALVGTIESPEGHTATKVISDHLRAAAFLIADGVTPSASGRGYVLRRLLRRAITHGYRLGISDPFLGKLFPALKEVMVAAYPELESREEVILSTLRQEEESFAGTLRDGWKALQEILEELKRSQVKEIPSGRVFQLYDTFGFPPDLTSHFAAERNLFVDFPAVQKLMDSQRERGRQSWKGSGSSLLPETVRQWKSQGITSTFTGYHHTHQSSRVLAITEDEETDDRVSMWLAIEPCPFYAMAGGQVGDSGYLIFPSGIKLRVKDTQQPYPEGIALHVEGSPSEVAEIRRRGELTNSALLHAEVLSPTRQSTQKHHTATHLLHAALRAVLGPSVQQAGSFVNSERLRFDFTFPRSLTEEELSQVTEWVRDAIHQSLPITTEEMPLSRALESGATALFSEKYAERVRVVNIPNLSRELCGGTHATNTSDLGLFHILSEKSIATGTRRIEAVAGRAAEDWFQEQWRLLCRSSEAARVSPAQLPAAVKSLREELRRAQTSIQTLQRQLTATAAQTSEGTLGTATFRVYELPDNIPAAEMRHRAKNLRTSEPQVIHLLRCGNSFALSVGEELPLHAGNLLQKLLLPLGGKGGGKADIAHGHCPATVTPESLFTNAATLE